MPAVKKRVKNCLEDFAISKKVVSFTQDGGSNSLTCKRALEDSVDNSEIFLPKQRIFEQECTKSSFY